jgi:hypothetical protein
MRTQLLVGEPITIKFDKLKYKCEKNCMKDISAPLAGVCSLYSPDDGVPHLICRENGKKQFWLLCLARPQD